MPRPSRQQQLDHAVEAIREKIAAEQRKLASLASAQREEARKVRDRRRYQVGRLAEACGLCDLDDADLHGLFAALQVLSAVPNPVAVLEALLKDVGDCPGRSVDGLAHAAHGVSPLG